MVQTACGECGAKIEVTVGRSGCTMVMTDDLRETCRHYKGAQECPHALAKAQPIARRLSGVPLKS